MINTIHNVPEAIQKSYDSVLENFRSRRPVSQEHLDEIQTWLEVDGWDALIADPEELMAIRLHYVAELEFRDSELCANLGLDPLSVTDSDRLSWARQCIDWVRNNDDGYKLVSVFPHRLTATDGSYAILGCLVEIHGQAGPVCQWQGLWNTRREFLEAISVGHEYWLISEQDGIPDEVILSLWQKPNKRKTTRYGTKKCD